MLMFCRVGDKAQSMLKKPSFLREEIRQLQAGGVKV